jgi:hypothetical protein
LKYLKIPSIGSKEISKQLKKPLKKFTLQSFIANLDRFFIPVISLPA